MLASRHLKPVEAAGRPTRKDAVCAKGIGAMCALLLICFMEPAAAQQRAQNAPDLGRNVEWFPRAYKPYKEQKISQIDLANTESLSRLIQDGKLRISLSQLKTAVNDNNLDILATNNAAQYAQTDLLRAKGGGAPRGGAG